MPLRPPLTFTWNSGVGSFDDPAQWSPNGVPQAGDTAKITGGTVTAQNDTLDGLLLAIASSASSAPTLALTNSTLTSSSRLEGMTGSREISLAAAGAVVNNGIITLASGAFGGQYLFSLANAGVAGVVENDGTINAKDSSINFTPNGTAGALVNNGTISVWNPDNAVQAVSFAAPVTGTGATILQTSAQVLISNTVVSTQTFQFQASGGNAAIEIVNAAGFHGKISGLSTTDYVRIDNALYTSYSYASTGANAGTLTLTNNGTTTASIDLLGTYSTADFSLNTADLGGGNSLTSITTTQPLPAKNFAFTDTELNLNGSAAGMAYSDPNLPSLKSAFFWAGNDPVAIAASTPDVFLKGGPSGDALLVNGGVNVLDGGGGSNYLVGGTGAGSQDAFIVDGRGSVVTWSTFVNFHQADYAAIFGFRQGLSDFVDVSTGARSMTPLFQASQGAPGAEGATIHVELNGAGTGINASITFAGADVATAGKYTASYGLSDPKDPNTAYILFQNL